MKKLVILFALVSLQTAIVFAGNGDNKNNSKTNNTQTTQISGQVVDFSNQEALAGVAIKVLGSDQVVYSDLDGNFSLKNIPAGQKIEIQVNYISYKAVTIRDLKANVVKISLSKIQ